MPHHLPATGRTRGALRRVWWAGVLVAVLVNVLLARQFRPDGARTAPTEQLVLHAVVPDVAADSQLCPAPPVLRHGELPPYDPNVQNAAAVKAAVAYYTKRGESPFGAYEHYTSTADYLNYGSPSVYDPPPGAHFDDLGIPLVNRDGTYLYSPVSTAQYALHLYGGLASGAVSQSRFLLVVDRLLTLEQTDGSFPMPFPYTYYRTGETLAPGWTSEMAQGQALSVYARAYSLTSNPKYAAAGSSALVYLLAHATTLGTLDPALGGYVWYEEYPTAEPYYTLNGFMFTLLGLYDWSHVASGAEQSRAAAAFADGVGSLSYVLPYFDAGGFSAYDLSHLIAGGAPNLQPEYHTIHEFLLHALTSVTGDERLGCYEQLWLSEVGQGRL